MIKESLLKLLYIKNMRIKENRNYAIYINSILSGVHLGLGFNGCLS